MKFGQLTDYSKKNKTLDYIYIQRFAQLWFFKKGLGLVSPPHFAYDFSRKISLFLYCINWPNLIIWLPLRLEILDNMFIEIVRFLGSDAITPYIS